MKNRIILFIKGFCMGIADVIPGVSGGTMALILGVYTRWVNAIKSVNFDFVIPFFKWVGSGFKKEAFNDLKKSILTWHWGFLIFLGAGVIVAFLTGAKLIPYLMVRYPSYMRGIFFGLILASLSVPFKLILNEEREEKRGGGIIAMLIVVVLAFTFGTYFLVGDLDFKPPSEMITYQASSDDDSSKEVKKLTLEEIAQKVPSSYTPMEIYQMPENQELRKVVPPPSDAEDGLAYAELEVPSEVPVNVPRPPYWYIFLCALIAICAMVLPGISGSYILLILGEYYFMLNAVHGREFVYIGIFMVGAVIGIMGFSRLLSFLLKKYSSWTMAGLLGIMAGGLRSIWPFRAVETDMSSNVFPSAMSPEVIGPLVAIIIGFAIVAGLLLLGSKLETGEGSGK